MAFRFGAEHRRELVEFIDGMGGDGEAEVAVMEAFEAEGVRHGEKVLNAWCGCEAALDETYYRRANGRHGYYCRRCLGITQTG
jgi:hypothetical protein